MSRSCAWVSAVSAILLVPAAVPAGVLLEDDFGVGTEPDAAKWTQIEDAGCDVSLSGGVLVTSFKGAAASRRAYAVSNTLALPAGWTNVTVTGQWAFVVPGLGECDIMVYDPSNTLTRLRASYVNWTSDHLRMQYTDPADPTKVISEDFARQGFPAVLTDFEMTFTPTGWRFTTEGGTTDITRASTGMSGLTEIQLMIGGWEYSAVNNVAHFDNIRVSVVPEPATMALLAAGGAMLVFVRRR